MTGKALTVSSFIVYVVLSLKVIKPLVAINSCASSLNGVKIVINRITKVLRRPRLRHPRGDGDIPGSGSIALRSIEFNCRSGRVLRKMAVRLGTKAMGTVMKPSKDNGSAVTGLVTSL